jgi:lysophospholipid acyltransferase (LPLAT)-like uncharacterized protein
VQPHLPALIYFLARIIGASLRLRVVGYERYAGIGTGAVFAGWHGRTFIAASFFRGKGVWTIISTSRDGDMQNAVFSRFGFRTIRGSSGRSGVRAAIEAIKVLRSGGTMAFTPDGPRGPSGVVQPGIVLMAQKSGALLVPVGVSSRWRVLARSWDRYMIPLPFSRAIMIFGDPIALSRDATPAEADHARLALERAMHRLEAEAEAAMGHAAPVSE